MARSAFRGKRKASSTPSNRNDERHDRRKKAVDLGRSDPIIESSSEEDSDDERDIEEPTLQSDESSMGDHDDEQDDAALESKRVRLAREYLKKVDAQSSSEEDDDEDDENEHSDDGGDDDDDDDHSDTLGKKLQRDRLKREGALDRVLARKVQQHITQTHAPITRDLASEHASEQLIRQGCIHLLGGGHDLTPTCVALSGDARTAISGSKDHSVMLWDLEKQCRSVTIYPHWKKISRTIEPLSKTLSPPGAPGARKQKSTRSHGQVLAVALSDQYAAVGRQSGLVEIYDIRTNGPMIKSFEGHKGAVTSLCFRTNTHQLFSTSEDRCIRHYNLDEMMYIETLYGHQFAVTGIDCHLKERPVSVGRDRTARGWKIAEETHLIYRGGSKLQSAQSVSVIKDDWFLTGHEDGHLCLWMADKKKAVATLENVHGAGNEVVSVACPKNSDIAASGSNDNYLRLWKVLTGRELKDRGLEPLATIPVRGYINAIAFDPKAQFCVVALGQEHRLGRWNRVPAAKNRIAIIPLRSVDTDKDESVGNNGGMADDVVNGDDDDVGSSVDDSTDN